MTGETETRGDGYKKKFEAAVGAAFKNKPGYCLTFELARFVDKNPRYTALRARFPGVGPRERWRRGGTITLVQRLATDRQRPEDGLNLFMLL